MAYEAAVVALVSQDDFRNLTVSTEDIVLVAERVSVIVLFKIL